VEPELLAVALVEHLYSVISSKVAEVETLEALEPQVQVAVEVPHLY
jgi:hypothetical protein